MKRVSSRKRKAIDYVKLNEGDGIIVKNRRHPHIERMLDYYFANTKPNTDKKIKRESGNSNQNDSKEKEYINYFDITGEQLTKEFVVKHRFDIPIWIKKKNEKGTGLRVPKELSVSDVAKNVGENHKVEVMEVVSQEGLKNWTLKEWKEYFEDDQDGKRENILNVISLEVSGTQLGDEIRRPRLVEELDIVDKTWPEKFKYQRKSVAKYCLMSVKDCYTDYHLDFAGTQVYYKVIKGSKIFSFIPPTRHNLKNFVKWSKLRDQNQIFFPEFLEENSKRKGKLKKSDNDILNDENVYKDVDPRGFSVVLNEGDLLMIPSGWIHAVYTPEDSIVIGGNFLTLMNMHKQLDIVETEKELGVESRYLFPDFRKSMWFIAKYFLDTGVGVRHDASSDQGNQQDSQKGKATNEESENWSIKENAGKEGDKIRENDEYSRQEGEAVVELWERYLKKDKNVKDLHISKILGGQEQFIRRLETYFERLCEAHNSET